MRFQSSEPFDSVIERLSKAGEDFWSIVELNADDGTLALSRNTFWKGGPLWRFEGQLAATQGGTELEGQLSCRTWTLWVPYVFIAFVMSFMLVPQVGLTLNLVRIYGMMWMMVLPFSALRWWSATRERRGILGILEQAGLR